jgi:hypothetical protein
MMTAILAGLWLMTWLGRGTPIGALLHRLLVDLPAARLSRISRGQVLLWMILAGGSMALVWLLQNDGRMLVAMGLPEVLSFAAAVDLATFVDLSAVALAAAGSVRMQALGQWIAHRLPAGSRRRPRTVRVRRPRPPANDDERPALPARAMTLIAAHG